MSNNFLWHVLNVNTMFLILTIAISHCFRDLILISVDLIDCLVKLIIVLIFLTSEAIEPNIFIILIIRYDIGGLVSQVLPSKLHRSFNLYLLHTAIFLISVDIRCWDINSSVGIK